MTSMDTDTSHIVPSTEPDRRLADLVITVQDHCRTVIEGELHRLSRRVPTLSADDVEIIDAALADIAENLILSHLRTAPRQSAPLLWGLFVVPGRRSRAGFSRPHSPAHEGAAHILQRYLRA